MNQKREQMLAELEGQLIGAATELTKQAAKTLGDGLPAYERSVEGGVGWMLRLSLDILAEAKGKRTGTGVPTALVGRALYDGGERVPVCVCGALHAVPTTPEAGTAWVCANGHPVAAARLGVYRREEDPGQDGHPVIEFRAELPIAEVANTVGGGPG